jgi:hypothetical protein
MEYLVPILTGYKYTKQPPAQFHHHSVVPILCTQSVFRRKSILFFSYLLKCILANDFKILVGTVIL